MKIGIVRLSSLGDIIVSGVFMPFLKECLKDCKIDWFVDSRFCEILESGEILDGIYPLELKENLKSFKILKLKHIACKLAKLERYDILIDMQGLIKSAIIGKIIPHKHFVGFDFLSARESLSSFAYSKKAHIAYEEHILKRNAKLILSALEICGQKLNFTLEEMLKNRNKMFAINTKSPFQKQDKKCTLFIIESSLESKTYSTQNFIKLGKKLLEDNIQVLILVDKNLKKAKDIASALDNEANILPKMSLLEVRALMQEVDVVIGGDTGITHLAWAMKIPSVTLYGNTPASRFSLDSAQNLSLCGNANPQYNKSDFSINYIKPDFVYEAIQRVL